MENLSRTPGCVGIIMDGNRRWARKQGLPVFEGHRNGYEKLKETTDWAIEAGIGTLIVYAFSEENWKRTGEELDFMMGLIRSIIKDQISEAQKKNIRVTFIGAIDKFAEDIVEGMHKVHEETKGNTGLHLVIAASYGGRQEILRAVADLVKERIEQEAKEGSADISVEEFEKHLYTTGIPDPDMVIRTSGEMRISGFLPWQTIYSELFFTPTFWPDFSREEFTKILNEFTLRQRRLGK